METDLLKPSVGHFLHFFGFLTLSFYDKLPDIIPIHFDLLGQPNDHGSKLTIMFLPIIGTLVFIGLTVLNMYPHIFNLPVKINESNAQRQYTNATRMLRILKISITLIFSLVVVMVIEASKEGNAKSNIWLMPIILGIIIIPITYFLTKAIKMR
jgi:Na+/melibiose symporter-like transporter